MPEHLGDRVEPLRDGGEFTLHRGHAPGHPCSVLIVTAASQQPSPQSLRQLEHEWSLAADLEPTWAAPPLEVTHRDGRTMLILADPGGELLDCVLARRDRPLEVHRVLRIAIGLANALGHVHRRGLIHKDIKPANVLVDNGDHVWLTGFGIASRLPRESQVPAPPEIMAGTLAYMAPEQTGRMNRSIDTRSDLYSLGVTLYEMLTGTLPFSAVDPIGWVHCHIAQQPTPPRDHAGARVPAPLSQLTMKLLAKNAEERYQTATGVEADLRQCLARWESSGRIEAFPLGMHDASDRLRIPEKLYGRESQIEALLAAFSQVSAEGTPALVLVSGYSGVGKSSVVNELHKALIPARALFASGKSDQYSRDIPYTSLAHAFRTLVRQVLAKSEAEVGQWRAALTEAVGASGQLIVNLVPDVEYLIGTQPTVPDLPPHEAKHRLQMVIRQFLGAFARAEHPLVLFLDDVQWLDAATLDLLERLITHAEARYLLLVAAYRDNEVTPTHPLVRTLETIRSTGARVHDIVLAPLDLKDVSRLIADALHCDTSRAEPVAHLVHEKTGGNPFFAIQFFTALGEEGLVTFDPVPIVWRWDVDRIRAKGYTDNVVEFMVGKLKRLPERTQDALKPLACLGDSGDAATLSLVSRDTEGNIHAALWEAVRAGVVFFRDGIFQFSHDRIQQAAYSLIPDDDRAGIHVSIGRAMQAILSAADFDERLFDVANQFERGAMLLVDEHEKVQVATIHLRAGRKAKASAAYSAACRYLAAGMALLDEACWASCYELTFRLSVERAECEFLTGNFETADELIDVLLQRGASNVDRADAIHLKIQLHEVKGEYPDAVDAARRCLHWFGIDVPAHPTREQVEAEFEIVWRHFEGRPIESLIDLPLMSDPDLRAAMHVLSILLEAAYFADFDLYCVILCRMVNLSIHDGVSGAAAVGYGLFGTLVGQLFQRYHEGYRFTRLACDLVEKHGFLAYQAKVCFSMGLVAPWTQPIATAIEFNRAAFRIGIEAGDFWFACYGMNQAVMGLLERNDPLDTVRRESERGFDFAKKTGYRDSADTFVIQQRFIAALQGRTAAFSTFGDAEFDEAAFEAQLTPDRVSTMIGTYWILKLKARFLSGDYAEALASADKAKTLLGALAAQMIGPLNYFYYTALTVAALYERGSVDEKARWRDLLHSHQEQLRKWAAEYQPTFGDKYALVSAEIARLEGRAAEAMALYEEAIKSAREHGFVQNEALAHELAARFFAAHGVETVCESYRRNARYCYLRWGAEGKVRQLEQLYPHLREDARQLRPTATIGAPIRQLDVETVIKASQALSSEIVLSKVIEKLMRIAAEHAGAERGLLILLRGDDLQIEAEAITGQSGARVSVRKAAITSSDLPQSALHYVIRTRERLVLDDAMMGNVYSEDAYVRAKRARSVLCLPIVKQTGLIGVLYLENNLTPRAFSSDRVALLEMVASQAAISLENATLYAELQRSEAFLAEAQRLSSTGSFSWRVDNDAITWSDELYRIFGLEPNVPLTLERAGTRIHPEDFRSWADAINRARTETTLTHDARLMMPDGSVKYLHAVAHAMPTADGHLEYIGAIQDVTEHRLSEQTLDKLRLELAHMARVMSLGVLTASITHEIAQPLSGIITNANTCQRMLSAEPPNADGAREAVGRLIRDGTRASDVINRLRALFGNKKPTTGAVDLNQAAREVIALTSSQLQRNSVVCHAELADALPSVNGDRVQIQQVILNLFLNASDAMREIDDRPRDLVIRTARDGHSSVRLMVRDVGVGVDADTIDKVFDAFYTTKTGGMGIGLSVSRSIIESHHGRLWVDGNDGPGATFSFSLPVFDAATPQDRPDTKVG